MIVTSDERPTRLKHAVEPAPEVLHGDVVPVEQQSPVFDRLHALVRKGYRPVIGTEAATDVVVLHHLGSAPDLVLHSDGVVEGWEGRRPRHKRNVHAPAAIAADRDAEHLRFMKFLDTVQPASLRDRTRPWRKKYVYVPVVLIAIWMICFAFSAILLAD